MIVELNSRLQVSVSVRQLNKSLRYSKRLAFYKNLKTNKSKAVISQLAVENTGVSGLQMLASSSKSRADARPNFNTIFSRRRFNLRRFLGGIASDRSSGGAVGPAVSARIKRLIRAVRSNRTMRRQWWRFVRQLQRLVPTKKYIRILQTHSSWRYPFYRQKIRIAARRRKLEKILSFKRRLAKRYMFIPRPFIKRIRHLYFMTNGFWKRSDDLIRLRISFTLNNVFIALADRLDRNLMSVSSGVLGFKGTTKLTTYAIERMAVHVSKFMRRKRYKNLYIIFNSGAVGYKAKLFVETLIRNALTVKYLTVSDAVPHNGVRPRKTKRR